MLYCTEDTPSNIMAWNRIRLYLLSFDSQVFVRRQLSLSAILLASFLLLVFQLVQFAAAEQLMYSLLTTRSAHVHSHHNCLCDFLSTFLQLSPNLKLVLHKWLCVAATTT